MSITTETFKDGRGQSVHFADVDGDEVFLVAVEEGDHNLGAAQCQQQIHILTGELSTPDGANYDGADVLTFEKGEVIVFTAGPGTSYLSFHLDE